MAALAYNLKSFYEQGDKREYVKDAHTNLLQQKVTFTRQNANAFNKPVQEYRFVMYRTSADANGDILPQPVTMECKLRFPVLADGAFVSGVVLDTANMLISDEYLAAYGTGNWLSLP